MSNPNQIIALEEYSYKSIFTVGETVGDYTPTGILDGLGAYAYDADTVRVLANSELLENQGYVYTLGQGTEGTSDDVTLTGARIQFFDINK